MTLRRLVPLLTLLLLACSTPEKREKLVWLPPASREAPAAVKGDPTELLGTETWSADKIADTFSEPKKCERAAKARRALNAELSWEVLKLCITRHHLPLLSRVLAEPWRAEFARREDGSSLLFVVLANRGGDLAADLASIREAGLPVLGLTEALTGRARDKGSVIVLRGRPISIAGEGTKRYPLVFEEFATGAAQRGGSLGKWGRNTAREEIKETGRTALARLDADFESGESDGDRLFFGTLEGFEREVRAGDEEAVLRPLVSLRAARKVANEVAFTE